MEELYIFNPFVFIIENKEYYLLRVGLEYEKKLPKNQFSRLIEKIMKNGKFTIEELLSYFSDKEIVELFTYRIFLEKEINLESIDSRNRGYFSLLQNEYYYDELKNKNIFILGAGAIGSHVAWMLAAMGMKNLTILDYDLVELSNLNRQLLYEYRDIGTSKVQILKKRLNGRFPEIVIKSIEDKIVSESNLRKYIDSSYDIVIRAIDTPTEVGSWVNKVCLDLEIPYIGGGFIGYKGVVGPSYVPSITPCLDCYEKEVEIDNVIHGTAGTLAPLTELVSSKIVYELIRIISKQKIIYNGIMEIIDPFSNSSEYSTLDTKKECKSCSLVREDKDILNDGKWQLVYFCGMSLIPFFVVLTQLPILFTLVSILLLTAILAWNTNLDKDVYEKSVYGGVLFAISNLLLASIRRQEIFNSNQPFIFFVASLFMQVLATVTLSISLFELITFFLLKIRNIVFNRRKKYANFCQKSKKGI